MSKARGLADLGNAYSDGALSNRNLIINGAMQVAQRGTSATGVTTSGYYSVDRFQTMVSGLGTHTVTQESDGPSGFADSYKIEVTTADASPAASDYVFLRQKFEGQNLQHIAKGTSDAKPMTLSFWVKSNATGTYRVSVRDLDNVRMVGATYSVSSSATWEYVTVLIPADTTGALDNDVGNSFEVEWWLDSGTSWNTGATPTAWEPQDNTDRNAGSNVNLGDTIGNYWAITGVQLEVGDTATPFEHRSYGDELARCQRYYWRRSSTATDDGVMNMNAYSINACYGVIPLPVMMRSSPTFSYNEAGSSFRYYGDNSAQYISTGGLSIANASPNSVEMLAVPSTSASQGSGGWLRFQDASQWIAYDAEL